MNCHAAKYFFSILLLIFSQISFLFSRSVIIAPSFSSEQINKVLETSSAGDTVIFRKGHYYVNNLMILKPLVLRGENYPELDGNNKFQIMSIGANDVRVEGFRFTNSGHSDMNEISAIKIMNVRNVTVNNNVFENVFFGVYCANASHCFITNNKIKSISVNELETGNGIHCWKSDSMHITGNTASGQRDGIYFEFVTNSVIEKNISERNLRYGLHFMFSHSNVYSGNTFSNNGAGVAVMFSHHVTMTGNIFSENEGAGSYGILLKEISDSHIEGNHFSRNTVGVYMEGTSRIRVVKNIFESNGWGFRIQSSCSDIVVEKNKFTANTFDVATNGTLVLNKFSNNYWDKYDGYDLNKDGIGDVPYRPVSLYSMVAEQMPYSIMLYRSFMVMLLERAEKAIPGITPVDLKDDTPLMKSRL
ncbi:MAG TPA: nitrous oxide reductase family maturation protein NosD [Bacteroidia bacterium]|nr:nitrous oxide reductase family maturation protein NosD [Bacteroidia bacterium]